MQFVRVQLWVDKGINAKPPVAAKMRRLRDEFFHVAAQPLYAIVSPEGVELARVAGLLAQAGRRERFDAMLRKYATTPEQRAKRLGITHTCLWSLISLRPLRGLFSALGSADPQGARSNALCFGSARGHIKLRRPS